MLLTDMRNQQMHIYKRLQSHIIILHQHVSVSSVTSSGCLVTRTQLLYNNNTKCMIKPLTVMLHRVTLSYVIEFWSLK